MAAWTKTPMQRATSVSTLRTRSRVCTIKVSQESPMADGVETQTSWVPTSLSEAWAESRVKSRTSDWVTNEEAISGSKTSRIRSWSPASKTTSTTMVTLKEGASSRDNRLRKQACSPKVASLMISHNWQQRLKMMNSWRQSRALSAGWRRSKSRGSRSGKCRSSSSSSRLRWE